MTDVLIYRLGSRTVTFTATGLIDVGAPVLVDANGLIILPDGYRLDVNGLIAIDLMWYDPARVGHREDQTPLSHQATGSVSYRDPVTALDSGGST